MTTIPLHPPAPEHLDDIAAQLWRELAPELAVDGKLAPAVAATLEIAVTAYANWRHHEARVAREGAIVKGVAGAATPHPSVALAAKAADSWRKSARVLGIDKKPKAAKPESKFAKLIQKRS